MPKLKLHWCNILTTAIILVALAARLLPGARTIDDSFITFRYARNILAGNGFAYNPGEHVLGTTTPLYTLLLTGLGAVTGGASAPFPALAMVINAAADALACLVLIQLGRQLGSLRAGFGAALVWSIAPFSVTFAIGGLETSVYVLLLCATTWAHLTRRRKLAALLGALALLTRPDALILLGPLALDRLWQWALEKKQAFPQSKIQNQPSTILFEALIFLLLVLAWGFFATLSFGSPLPHSIAAKSLAYRLPGNAALIRLIQHYAAPFLDTQTFGVPAMMVGVVLYPFLFALGALRALRQEPHSWPLLAYPWLYFAAFAIANPLIFRWYLTPPLPFYYLAVLLGADRLLSDVLAGKKQKREANQPAQAAGKLQGRGQTLITQAVLALVVVLAPTLLSLRDWQWRPDHGLSRPAPGMAWYKLELLYRQAANSLASEFAMRSGPPPVLAAGDVGVLGFFTPASILDTVGLNSAESTAYYPLDPALYVINYAIPPRLILDQKPDYIVILEVYGRKGLLPDPEFQAEYRLEKKIPTDIYGSDGMLIFARR